MKFNPIAGYLTLTQSYAPLYMYRDLLAHREGIESVRGGKFNNVSSSCLVKFDDAVAALTVEFASIAIVSLVVFTDNGRIYMLESGVHDESGLKLMLGGDVAPDVKHLLKLVSIVTHANVNNEITAYVDQLLLSNDITGFDVKLVARGGNVDFYTPFPSKVSKTDLTFPVNFTANTKTAIDPLEACRALRDAIDVLYPGSMPANFSDVAVMLGDDNVMYADGDYVVHTNGTVVVNDSGRPLIVGADNTHWTKFELACSTLVTDAMKVVTKRISALSMLTNG